MMDARRDTPARCTDASEPVHTSVVEDSPKNVSVLGLLSQSYAVHATTRAKPKTKIPLGNKQVEYGQYTHKTRSINVDTLFCYGHGLLYSTAIKTNNPLEQKFSVQIPFIKDGSREQKALNFLFHAYRVSNEILRLISTLTEQLNIIKWCK